MSNPGRMDTEKRQQIAVSRFGVIAELVTRKGMERGEREKLIGELSEKEWEIPHADARAPVTFIFANLFAGMPRSQSVCRVAG